MGFINNKLVTRPRWSALTQTIDIERKEKFWRDMLVTAEWQNGFIPHDLQRIVAQDRTRHKVLCCGRRWGKSLFCATEALHVASLGGWVWVVAPSYELSDIIFEDAAMIAEGSEYRHLLDGQIRMQKGAQRLKTITGGRIFAKSSEKPNSLLGRGLDLVIFDEASKEKNGNVWDQYISPTLSDRIGGSILISTPSGNDWFKQRWNNGDPRNPDRDPSIASWQFESRQNPHFLMSEWEYQKTHLPQRVFDQEYRAIFLDDAGGVFRGVSKVANLEVGDMVDIQGGTKWTSRETPEPIPGGGRYVIGVDLAIYNDFTVITVLDAVTKKMVYMERFNQISFPMQKERIVSTSRRWGNAPVCIDSTGAGDPIVSELIDSGAISDVLGYKFSNASKAQVINTLSIAIEQQEIQLLKIENPLLNELASYQYSRTAAGTITMNAPSGMHDDCVISLALAWHLVMGWGGSGLPSLVLDPRRGEY